MTNKLLFILFLLTPTLSRALDEHQFAVRIQRQDHKVILIRLQEKDVIPAVIQDKGVETLVAKLQSGEEAIVKGHVIFEPKTSDDSISYRPIFVVREIIPVSLVRLNEPGFDVPDLQFIASEKSFTPYTYPVSTEIATAITLTATMLLMQGLTASSGDPQGRQEINQKLFLFAGMLATGSFIFDP